MSAYIKLSTLEYPRHEGDIRLEHPEIGDEFVCPPEYAEVFATPQPVFVEKEQCVYELPPENIDGVWTMVWAVHTYTQEEKDFMASMQNPNNVPPPDATVSDPTEPLVTTIQL